MDYSDQILVESTVMQFINDGSSFSAYDVTKTVRGLSSNRIYHNEVNSSVQGIYAQDEMGQYQRELVDVGSAVSPWVYHDPNVDAQSYDKDWLNTDSEPTDVAVAVADDDDDDDDADGFAPTTLATATPCVNVDPNAIYVRPASDGRITISAKLIAKLCANPNLQGTTLAVVPSTDTIAVRINGVTAKQYRVDEDNRIRVSMNLLRQAGLDQEDELKLSLVNDVSGNWIRVTAP